MIEKIISTSIKKIKDRWINYCVNTNQHRAKTQDYKDLQYIDKLILDGLDNDTINTRLERYRKIRITDESLNKKREEFKKRMNKPSKRVDLAKWHYDEIENNPYYNQKVVWCNNCSRTHRLNTDVANEHPVKPIPIKCEADEDHCWKWKGINQRKIFGIDIYNHNDYKDGGLFITYSEGVVEECIVCDKKGLEESMMSTRMDNVDITATQLNEVKEYIQSIKSMKFENLEKLNHKSFNNGEIIQIPELDKKIREIQNIGDYIIII